MIKSSICTSPSKNSQLAGIPNIIINRETVAYDNIQYGYVMIQVNTLSELKDAPALKKQEIAASLPNKKINTYR